MGFPKAQWLTTSSLPAYRSAGHVTPQIFMLSRGCAQRSAAASSRHEEAAARAEICFARKNLTDGARLDNQSLWAHNQPHLHSPAADRPRWSSPAQPTSPNFAAVSMP